MSSSTPKLRIAILFSGRGSNMKAVIDAVLAGKVDAQVVMALTHNPNAAGIPLAQSAGVPVSIVNPRSYPTPQAYERAVLGHLVAARTELVVLAGYMKILGPTLLEAFSGRIINIHPSLLPAFKGLHAQRQALESGVTMTGCTVHFVTSALDGGPVIMQVAVPILPDDDELRLSDRILAEEHRLLPQAIHRLATTPGLLPDKGEY